MSSKKSYISLHLKHHSYLVGGQSPIHFVNNQDVTLISQTIYSNQYKMLSQQGINCLDHAILEWFSQYCFNLYRFENT